MIVAGLSVALMIYVLVVYGLRDERPRAPASSENEPHAGTQHHSAEKHEGDALAPVQPAVRAVVGAWAAHAQTTRFASAPPSTVSIMQRVEAVTDADITVVRTERENGLTPPTSTRDQRPRQGLTIDRLAGNTATEWTVFGVTTTDEARVIDGRTFACKKLTFELISPLDRRKRGRVEMWISDEVPIDGVVEARQTLEGMSLERSSRLVGFGTADTITWGKKLDGL